MGFFLDLNVDHRWDFNPHVQYSHNVVGLKLLLVLSLRRMHSLWQCLLNSLRRDLLNDPGDEAVLGVCGVRLGHRVGHRFSATAVSAGCSYLIHLCNTLLELLVLALLVAMSLLL